MNIYIAYPYKVGLHDDFIISFQADSIEEAKQKLLKSLAKDEDFILKVNSMEFEPPDFDFFMDGDKFLFDELYQFDVKADHGYEEEELEEYIRKKVLANIEKFFENKAEFIDLYKKHFLDNYDTVVERFYNPYGYDYFALEGKRFPMELYEFILRKNGYTSYSEYGFLLLKIEQEKYEKRIPMHATLIENP